MQLLRLQDTYKKQVGRIQESACQVTMISKQTQNILEQAQLYQQQIQGVVAQKEALNMQLIEINKSLEELRKTKEKEIYKISGPILIKQPIQEVRKDLDQKKELIDLRIKT